MATPTKPKDWVKPTDFLFQAKASAATISDASIFKALEPAAPDLYGRRHARIGQIVEILNARAASAGYPKHSAESVIYRLNIMANAGLIYIAKPQPAPVEPVAAKRDLLCIVGKTSRPEKLKQPCRCNFLMDSALCLACFDERELKAFGKRQQVYLVEKTVHFIALAIKFQKELQIRKERLDFGMLHHAAPAKIQKLKSDHLEYLKSMREIESMLPVVGVRLTKRACHEYCLPTVCFTVVPIITGLEDRS